MDWIQFLQIICVPAFGWFFYKLGEQRKEIKLLERDLNEFKVAVAKEYATQVNIKLKILTVVYLLDIGTLKILIRPQILT